MSHAVVLLFAAVLYGVSFSTYLNRATGPIDVRAANVGYASMGRYPAIIKPIPIPTAPLPSRAPIFYTVKAGDTPAGIAKTLGVTLREITWSNPGLRVPSKVGRVLLVAPVPGFVVGVKTGDPLARLAAASVLDAATRGDGNRILHPPTPRPTP